jgi:uncharacterized membrane protein
MMMLAFQILIFIIIILFGMGALSERDKELNLRYTCVTIASLIAMCVTFWIE